MQAISDLFFGSNSPPPAVPSRILPLPGVDPLPAAPSSDPSAPIAPVGENHEVSWLRGITNWVAGSILGLLTNPFLRIAICIAIMFAAMVGFVMIGTTALTPLNIAYAAFGLTFLILGSLGTALYTFSSLISDDDNFQPDPVTTPPELPPPTVGSAMADALDFQPF